MVCSIKDDTKNLPDGYVLIEEMNCAVKLSESWDGKYVILYEAFDDTMDGATLHRLLLMKRMNIFMDTERLALCFS